MNDHCPSGSDLRWKQNSAYDLLYSPFFVSFRRNTRARVRREPGMSSKVELDSLSVVKAGWL